MSKNRKVVVVIRERGGETLPGVFKSEIAALLWVKHRVAKARVALDSCGVCAIRPSRRLTGVEWHPLSTDRYLISDGDEI